MTDEDERMDRARRIREMREGSQPDEAQSDDPTEAETNDEDRRDDPQNAAGERQAPEDGPDAPGNGLNAVDAADAEGEPDRSAADGGDDGSTMHVPGAEAGDVDVDVEEMARQAGLASAGDSGEVDVGDGDGAAVDDDPTGPVSAVPGVEDEQASTTSEETRVLEFALGSEQYCLDIEYVEEIVKRETVTRVPNTPDCVEGVVDLRGQITTILDPKVLLDIDQVGSQDLIVVFDPDQFDDHGAVGWVVDDVDRVMPVSEDEVNSSPVDQSHVNGVVDRDGGFVIWTSPELDVEELAG